MSDPDIIPPSGTTKQEWVDQMVSQMERQNRNNSRAYSLLTPTASDTAEGGGSDMYVQINRIKKASKMLAKSTEEEDYMRAVKLAMEQHADEYSFLKAAEKTPPDWKIVHRYVTRRKYNKETDKPAGDKRYFIVVESDILDAPVILTRRASHSKSKSASSRSWQPMYGYATPYPYGNDPYKEVKFEHVQELEDAIRKDPASKETHEAAVQREEIESTQDAFDRIFGQWKNDFETFKDGSYNHDKGLKKFITEAIDNEESPKRDAYNEWMGHIKSLANMCPRFDKTSSFGKSEYRGFFRGDKDNPSEWDLAEGVTQIIYQTHHAWLSQGEPDSDTLRHYNYPTTETMRAEGRFNTIRKADSPEGLLHGDITPDSGLGASLLPLMRVIHDINENSDVENSIVWSSDATQVDSGTLDEGDFMLYEFESFLPENFDEVNTTHRNAINDRIEEGTISEERANKHLLNQPAFLERLKVSVNTGRVIPMLSRILGDKAAVFQDKLSFTDILTGALNNIVPKKGFKDSDESPDVENSMDSPEISEFATGYFDGGLGTPTMSKEQYESLSNLRQHIILDKLDEQVANTLRLKDAGILQGPEDFHNFVTNLKDELHNKRSDTYLDSAALLADDSRYKETITKLQEELGFDIPTPEEEVDDAAAEAERLEREEAERVEREEAERLEAERLEAERVEAERVEAERVAQERADAEREEADQPTQEEREQQILDDTLKDINARTDGAADALSPESRIALARTVMVMDQRHQAQIDGLNKRTGGNPTPSQIERLENSLKERQADLDDALVGLRTYGHFTEEDYKEEFGDKWREHYKDHRAILNAIISDHIGEDHETTFARDDDQGGTGGTDGGGTGEDDIPPVEEDGAEPGASEGKDQESSDENVDGESDGGDVPPKEPVVSALEADIGSKVIVFDTEGNPHEATVDDRSEIGTTIITFEDGREGTFGSTHIVNSGDYLSVSPYSPDFTHADPWTAEKVKISELSDEDLAKIKAAREKQLKAHEDAGAQTTTTFEFRAAVLAMDVETRRRAGEEVIDPATGQPVTPISTTEAGGGGGYVPPIKDNGVQGRFEGFNGDAESEEEKAARLKAEAAAEAERVEAERVKAEEDAAAAATAEEEDPVRKWREQHLEDMGDEALKTLIKPRLRGYHDLDSVKETLLDIDKTNDDKFDEVTGTAETTHKENKETARRTSVEGIRELWNSLDNKEKVREVMQEHIDDHVAKHNDRENHDLDYHNMWTYLKHLQSLSTEDRRNLLDGHHEEAKKRITEAKEEATKAEQEQQDSATKDAWATESRRVSKAMEGLPALLDANGKIAPQWDNTAALHYFRHLNKIVFHETRKNLKEAGIDTSHITSLSGLMDALNNGEKLDREVNDQVSSSFREINKVLTDRQRRELAEEMETEEDYMEDSHRRKIAADTETSRKNQEDYQNRLAEFGDQGINHSVFSSTSKENYRDKDGNIIPLYSDPDDMEKKDEEEALRREEGSLGEETPSELAKRRVSQGHPPTESPGEGYAYHPETGQWVDRERFDSMAAHFDQHLKPGESASFAPSTTIHTEHIGKDEEGKRSVVLKAHEPLSVKSEGASDYISVTKNKDGQLIWSPVKPPEQNKHGFISPDDVHHDTGDPELDERLNNAHAIGQIKGAWHARDHENGTSGDYARHGMENNIIRHHNLGGRAAPKNVAQMDDSTEEQLRRRNVEQQQDHIDQNFEVGAAQIVGNILDFSRKHGGSLARKFKLQELQEHASRFGGEVRQTSEIHTPKDIARLLYDPRTHPRLYRRLILGASKKQEALGSPGKGALGGAKKLGQKLVSPIVEGAGKAATGAALAGAAAIDRTAERVGDVKEKVGDVKEKVGDKIRGGLYDGNDKVNTLTSAISDKTGEVIDRTKEGASQAASNIAEGVSGVGQSLTDPEKLGQIGEGTPTTGILGGRPVPTPVSGPTETLQRKPTQKLQRFVQDQNVRNRKPADTSFKT